MKVWTSIDLLVLTLCAAAPARAQQADEGVRLLLERIERGRTRRRYARVLRTARRCAIAPGPATSPAASWLPGVSRSVLQERDRIR
jgi:hypothetical protein